MITILKFVTKYLPLRKLGRNGDYLHRSFVIRTPWFGIFIHRFLESDSSDRLHSHPFPGFSIILSGSYVEERLHGNVVKSKVLRPFDFNFLNKKTFHRVDLLTKEVWTLFVRGPKPKKKDYQWGFIDRNTLEYLDSEKYITDGSLLEDID